MTHIKFAAARPCGDKQLLEPKWLQNYSTEANLPTPRFQNTFDGKCLRLAAGAFTDMGTEKNGFRRKQWSQKGTQSNKKAYRRRPKRDTEPSKTPLRNSVEQI